MSRGPFAADVLARRALTHVRLSGLDVTRGRTAERTTIRVGTLATVAAVAAGADVYAAVDAPHLDGGALDAALASIGAAGGDEGALVLLVGSESAAALASSDRSPPSDGDGPWEAARAWGRRRAGATKAPAVTPERLRTIAARADLAGLVLVEPELAPPLAALRATFATPLDRAVLTLVGRGLLARPLLFVPRDRAPKGGLLRPRLERIADSWVQRTPALEEILGPTEASLEAAALARLASGELLTGKDLLRGAREGWTRARAAEGKRAVPSAGDASTLAAILYRLFLEERAEIFVTDPRGDALSIEPAPSDPHQEA